MDLPQDRTAGPAPRLNPVQKRLVKRPEDWPWPSFNNFALDKQVVSPVCLILRRFRIARQRTGGVLFEQPRRNAKGAYLALPR
jgi:hypothetical protein